MANISLTATCNRSCAFCFAAEAMATQGGAGDDMPLDRVEASLDFLIRSGIRQARLLGGEPTIHPDFERIVDLTLAKGLSLLVFSGGLIPERALQKLESLSPSEFSLLLNVIQPTEGNPRETARQQAVMRRLKHCVTLGVTIDSPAVRLGFLVELIERYDLARVVRLGLAYPVLNGSNAYLHPRHYPEVGRRVAEFGFVARERGVRLDFDCGWVPCMFPEGALEGLGIGPGQVGLRCDPILDLMPDGHVISCYPLASRLTAELPLDRDAGWMRQHFAERRAVDRALMLYRECETCHWRARGECTGGCLSASLGRLRRRELTINLPE